MIQYIIQIFEVLPMLARTMIQLEQGQLNDLTRIAKENGTSRTQIIREAIMEFLKSQKSGPSSHKLVQFAGILKDKTIDGLEFQHKIRDEWTRE